MQKVVLSKALFFAVFIFLLPFVARGDVYTSTNYQVLDPVINIGGNRATSTSFDVFQILGQYILGTSTSAGFYLQSGFLAYPFASSPVVTATAGNGQVALSWSASQGYLGWTVSGYNVGQSTSVGGPYTYSSSLGNVTSSTATGLINGTTYYFVIRAEDFFGNSVATSSEKYATPVAPTTPPVTPPPSGGGGGGGIITPSTRVILKGMAYPGATINILKDGSVAKSSKIDAAANFEEEIPVTGGLYVFSIYAIDSESRRSLTFSFTANVPSGLTTTISDIILAPTIGADKSQVKLGNDIKFFGYSYPSSQINVIINSEEPIIDKATSNRLGYWAYNLDSGNLELGDHVTKSQTVIAPEDLKSPFSEALAFRVGNQDVAFGKLPLLGVAAPAACNKNGDINNDKKVNIVDFSIMLYFWNQRNPKNPCADMNGDGIVNLIDFSIMLYWWTG